MRNTSTPEENERFKRLREATSSLVAPSATRSPLAPNVQGERPAWMGPTGEVIQAVIGAPLKVAGMLPIAAVASVKNAIDLFAHVAAGGKLIDPETGQELPFDKAIDPRYASETLRTSIGAAAIDATTLMGMGGAPFAPTGASTLGTIKGIRAPAARRVMIEEMAKRGRRPDVPGIEQTMHDVVSGTWWHGRTNYPKIGETYGGSWGNVGNLGEPLGISLSKTPDVARRFSKRPLDISDKVWDESSRTAKSLSIELADMGASAQEIGDIIQSGIVPSKYANKNPKTTQLMDKYVGLINLPDYYQDAPNRLIARTFPLLEGPVPERVLPGWVGSGTADAQKLLKELYTKATSRPLYSIPRHVKRNPTVQRIADEQGREALNKEITEGLQKRGYRGVLYSPSRYGEHELRMFSPQDVLHLGKGLFRDYPQLLERVPRRAQTLDEWRHALGRGQTGSLSDIYKDVRFEDLIRKLELEHGDLSQLQPELREQWSAMRQLLEAGRAQDKGTPYKTQIVPIPKTDSFGLYDLKHNTFVSDPITGNIIAEGSKQAVYEKILKLGFDKDLPDNPYTVLDDIFKDAYDPTTGKIVALGDLDTKKGAVPAPVTSLYDNFVGTINSPDNDLLIKPIDEHYVVANVEALAKAGAAGDVWGIFDTTTGEWVGYDAVKAETVDKAYNVLANKHPNMFDPIDLGKLDIEDFGKNPELYSGRREASVALQSLSKHQEALTPQARRGYVKALETGGFPLNQTDFVPTTPTLAKVMLDRATEGDRKLGRTLEPHGGHGALVDEITMRGTKPKVLELDAERATLLGVEPEDFLSHKGKYDTIIMNPPESGGQSRVHLLHGYELLKPGGRLIAAMPDRALHKGISAANDTFSNWLKTIPSEYKVLRRTNMPSTNGMVKMQIISIDKPLDAVTLRAGDEVTGALLAQLREESVAQASTHFDPEGSGYDYETAKQVGGPDKTGHWFSLDPRTGMVLKGMKHPTINKTHEVERDLGNKIYKSQDGRYYSRPEPPHDSGRGPYETGIASWYGKEFHGKKMSNKQKFDMNKMSAAHRKLPFGTKIRVTDEKTGKNVVVEVTDRGPYKEGRVVDLSRKAAEKLGIKKQGLANVRIEIVEKAKQQPPSIKVIEK